MKQIRKSLESFSLNELKMKLYSLLNPKEEIILAYLYGSVLKGLNHKRSDVDLALYLAPQRSIDRWYEINLKNQLEEDFDNLVEFDIKIINQSNIKFLFNIIFNNSPLISRDRDFQVDFESNVLIRWYDMKPTYDLFYQERLELLKEESK